MRLKANETFHVFSPVLTSYDFLFQWHFSVTLLPSLICKLKKQTPKQECSVHSQSAIVSSLAESRVGSD